MFMGYNNDSLFIPILWNLKILEYSIYYFDILRLLYNVQNIKMSNHINEAID